MEIIFLIIQDAVQDICFSYFCEILFYELRHGC